MAKIGITELVLRDAHQSLFATRMRTEDMLPILKKMDQVGYWAVEMWGGATFDVPIRYLNQDPWDRLREIKKAMPNTNLMMLLRAQNVVAYRNFPDDIVENFVRLAQKNGIDVFRIFDALNDLRNMEVPIKSVKGTGAHCQASVSYTISPIHTEEYFVKKMLKLEEWGADSICIKDMAGMISPKRAYDIIGGYIEAGGKCPIDLHAHSISGMTGMAYQRAAEAGVSVVDCDISPFAEGTGHPATESTVYAFKGTEWDTGLDMELLMEIREYFRTVFNKYRHLIRIEALRPDPSIVLHQIPGGMMSNLVSQLEMQGAKDKLDAVLKEVPVVREELGFPPLVTPTSQVVGVQAVMNVLFGRYKNIPRETKDYVMGMYGQSPGPIRDEIKEIVLGPEWKSMIITGRPADSLEPEFEKRKKELEEMGLLKQEEDILTYAIYPQIGLKFLKGEASPEFTSEKLPLPLDHPQTRAMVKSFFPEVKDIYLYEEEPKGGGPVSIPTEFDVEVDGEMFEVKVSPKGGFMVAGGEGGAPAPPKDVEGGFKSPMQGNVLSIKVKEGDAVTEGQVIMTVEAMKMETEVKIDRAGTVKQIFVQSGATVATGDLLIQVL
ncbi:MAG: pyruvate/oxaloacetate carboxyltransferase [Candidatus Thermoplasmatota archaeon]|nr:pyruvate/oxaloacetate carboxyltransferase [Candidatus Thermoplasmatota archaeon]